MRGIALLKIAALIGEYRLAQMFKFNNSIMPNTVRIGWLFSSNKDAYRDAYSALKSMYMRDGLHLSGKGVAVFAV